MGPFLHILRTYWNRVKLLRESPVAMIGTGLVLFWIILGAFAHWLAPYDPTFQYDTILPMWSTSEGDFFLLGTDKLGRDITSRIIYGARSVLIYSTLATIIAFAIGIMSGLAAGYFRGLTDTILSFLANVVLSFPVIVLFVIIIVRFGASGQNVIIAVAFASSPGIFRIVRALTLDVRSSEYVFAAQTRGESSLYIMLVEILPNVRGPLIVDFCLRMGYTTISIGVLGFLGLGLPPPHPDWGGMINAGRSLAYIAPHAVLIPAISLSSFVLGLNLLADGLREISARD